MRKFKKALVLSLACAMGLSLVACGGNDDATTEAKKDDTTTEAAKDDASDATSEAEVSGSDEGKVPNIYAWNEEFKSRITDHYPGYKEVDATHGKIGDVDVVWTITPNNDNAYQNNLDQQLLKQADASADDKIDIFLVEADYALKYVDTDYTMPVKDLGITDYVAVQDQTKAVMEVSAGTADACVVDITLANAMTGEGTNYDDLASGISLSSEEYGVGFRKESDLTDAFNKFMEKCLADGSLQATAQLDRCLPCRHEAVAQAEHVTRACRITRLTGDERHLLRVQQLPIIIVDREIHLALAHVRRGRHVTPITLVVAPLLALEGQDIVSRPGIRHHAIKIDFQRIAHDGVKPVANRDLRARARQLLLLKNRDGIIVATAGQQDKDSPKNHPER